jgi:hypothetical protein
MTKNYWVGGVNEIIKKVLNGKRTIQQAKVYLEENFVGDTRKAFKHAAWESTSSDTTHELTVYKMLKDAIKLGFGKDFNLEGVFR